MTVHGNVMVCDQCGRQVSMPMKRGAGHKHSLTARVRDYFVDKEHWRHTEQGDLCPDHVEGR